jgi:hypothetical protein
MRALPGIFMLLAMLAVSPASSEEDRSGLVWLSGEEIRLGFAGKALAGLYPSQRPWNEFIYFDGTTDYREGSNRWKGTWWIRGREFCFSYPPPGVGGCFRVTRISSNCYELYEFDSSLSSEETPPTLAHMWNGRMWEADKPTTCEARPTV